MPRLALAALVLAFCLPGWFGHDLWPQDGLGFGRMWTMAHGSAADWLLPNVAGAPALSSGLLPAWQGAIFLLVLGPFVGEPQAAALSVIASYLAGLLLLWHGARRLARRDEALPVVSAFEDGASRLSYARLIGDNAVLLAVACVGVVLRMHQTQGDATAFALVGLAVFSLSSLEWSGVFAALGMGVACAGLALTVGPMPALGMLGAGAVAIVLWRRSASGGALAALAVTVALICALAWPLAVLVLAPNAGAWLSAWLHAQPIAPARVSDALWALRTGVWFLWPLWPLVAWTLYAWRESLGAAHIARPLLLLVGLGAGSLFAAPFDDHLLVCLLPPLLVLAALGTATLRRAVENLVDWMAIALFSLVAFFFWAYWGAMLSGTPRAMAASVDRIVPGHGGAFLLPMALLGVAVTLAWAATVRWRVVRRPTVLWRGPALAASGVVLVWVLACALYQPAVDRLFSYRGLAVQMSHALRASPAADASCVRARNLPVAELGVLAYQARAAGFELRAAGHCPVELVRIVVRGERTPGERIAGALWEGVRPVRPDEHWALVPASEDGAAAR